jgi:DNA-binding protein H-NS
MAKLTLESIHKQIEKLQAQAKKMEGLQNAKKVKSTAQVIALMHKLGVSVEDLAAEAQKPAAPPPPRRGRRSAKPAKAEMKPKPGAKVRKPVAPKYRDPNSEETWTGRGKAPRWLTLLINAGHQKEEFLIGPARADTSNAESGYAHAASENISPAESAPATGAHPHHPPSASGDGHAEGSAPANAPQSMRPTWNL